MFLNQRGFGDVEIKKFTSIRFISVSFILDITASDARYVLQSDNLAGLVTGNTNTVSAIRTINDSQDTSLGQKLDK